MINEQLPMQQRKEKGERRKEKGEMRKEKGERRKEKGEIFQFSALILNNIKKII